MATSHILLCGSKSLKSSKNQIEAGLTLQLVGQNSKIRFDKMEVPLRSDIFLKKLAVIKGS
jgi:hypothetical protein